MQIANHKGIILFANDNGTYSVEDNDLRVTTFDNVNDATNHWSFLVLQE